MNRQKIQEALSYVHHWEQRGISRVTAAREACRGLNVDEAGVLLRAIHVALCEVA